MVLILLNVMMELSNVRIKGITEYEKSFITCDVSTSQCDERIRAKEKSSPSVRPTRLGPSGLAFCFYPLQYIYIYIYIYIFSHFGLKMWVCPTQMPNQIGHSIYD